MAAGEGGGEASFMGAVVGATCLSLHTEKFEYSSISSMVEALPVDLVASCDMKPLEPDETEDRRLAQDPLQSEESSL